MTAGEEESFFNCCMSDFFQLFGHSWMEEKKKQNLILAPFKIKARKSIVSFKSGGGRFEGEKHKCESCNTSSISSVNLEINGLFLGKIGRNCAVNLHFCTVFSQTMQDSWQGERKHSVHPGIMIQDYILKTRLIAFLTFHKRPSFQLSHFIPLIKTGIHNLEIIVKLQSFVFLIIVVLFGLVSRPGK